jgi:hypothetical protein
MNLIAAISRSESHNEITRINADNKVQAQVLISEARSIAEAAGLEFDWSDTNLGFDLWACKPGSEDMTWRVEISAEAL